jgi:protease I
MSTTLQGKKVAMLATDGVEQSELTGPREALEQAGARVDLISTKPGEIQGFKHLDKGDRFKVDRTLDDVSADQYDALVLPGGVVNPDRLRTDPRAVQLVRDFFAAHKPVGAICHGPWLLVEADVVRHRNVTSWPSLKTDIANAGGCWADEQVRVDNGLVTSRKPDNIPAFSARLIEEIAKGVHRSTPTSEVVRQPGPFEAKHDDATGDEDLAIEISSADSFPASDSPSSHQVT